MFWLVLICLLFAFTPIAVLVCYGGRRLRRVAFNASTEDVLSWPPVSILVPVKDIPDGMQRCLEAIVRQDYPGYEVLFITESQEDPAVAVIKKVIEDAGGAERVPGLLHAGHVVASLAKQCGQKNQNILTALNKISAESEVLVFCDSTHMARTNWLRQLVAPIARGEAATTTGYHHGLPATATLPNLGKTITILALYMLQEIEALTQPWGGNTAIRKDIFKRLGIAALWATNVVDDVSLARALDKAGLKAVPVPEACLETPIGRETFKGWRAWFERQWLYLKFIYPGTWMGVGVLLYLIALLTVLAPLFLLLGCCGVLGTGTAILALAYLAGLFWLGVRTRHIHPAPGGFWPWLGSFFTVLVMAGATHARTILTRELRWRDTVYYVGQRGTVLSLRRK